MRSRRYRLLSVGHSYCVALNRRLAHEMARLGKDRWEVVAVAPRFMHGDLRPIRLEEQSGELCRLEAVPARLSRYIHVMHYGRRLRELLREPWTLVHCWEEPYLLACAQVASLTPRNTPLVFWTAQNLAKLYPPPFCWIERYCLDRCAGWLACGHSIASTLGPRGYDRKPYRIMPLGVDLDLFRPNAERRREVRAKLGWQNDEPLVIGYSGRFICDKGLEMLMETLGAIRHPWRFLAIGGGPLEDILRNWAADYGDRVRIVTGVKHDQVPGYLNAMDVLCAPSLTMPKWREQQGRMLIEAFACGVPVVGSDSGEIPHVISDAGIVVAERDVGIWAATIERVLNSPAERREWSERGLERAQSVYSWTTIARAHLDFFEELIEGTR